MNLSRRAFSTGLATAGLAASLPRRSRASNKTVKVGVLTDMSSIYSSVLGPGSVMGAALAIEDFNKTVAGMNIELVSADHQNKPDVGSSIARRWYDEEGVDVIVDFGASAVGIAGQVIAKEKNKIVMISAASSELHGKYCVRNSFHWSYDTYMQSAPVAAAMTKLGGDTWFFVTTDWAFGHALEADATAQVKKNGGRVVGSVKTPINTLDFSSLILQAQASGAKIIGLAMSGDDLERFVRQGAEFNIWQNQRAAAFAMQLYNIPAIGLPVMRGVIHNSSFVWNRTDETRAFSKRFSDKTGKPPSEVHALDYSAVLSYLKAVQAAGTKDTDAVIKAINELPVEDVVSVKGKVREDGRLIRPTWLTEVKAEADVKETWDLLKIIEEIPGDKAFRPLSESTCPMIKT